MYEACLLEDIEKAFMEHGQGGLWNSTGYDVKNVVSIDMKSCFLDSFNGKGKAKSYYKKFGHPPPECQTRVYWSQT